MSVVSVSVFHYVPRARFRAFANMGRVLRQPIRAEGLRFSKLMGSGIDYGLIPDLSRYVHLGVWEHAAQADAFRQSTTYRQLTEGTDHVTTFLLQPLKSHGHWDGQNPFATDEPALTTFAETGNVVTRAPRRPQPTSGLATTLPDQALAAGGPVAVLTRATIRPGALLDFWRHVPQARQRLRDHADQLLFGIGVGEVPLLQQCTISVWRNARSIHQFAYRQSGHKEIVNLTRQRRWYSEELFARFAVLRWDA